MTRADVPLSIGTWSARGDAVRVQRAAEVCGVLLDVVADRGSKKAFGQAGLVLIALPVRVTTIAGVRAVWVGQIHR